MAPTILVNGLTMCHKGSKGIAIATLPDVCKTQVGNAVVPIPYPNIAKDSDLVDGSDSVTADGGNSIAIQGCKFSQSTGDEVGSIGGVSSGCTKGEAKFISFSPNVKADGKSVCRLTDKMTMNKENAACLGGILIVPLAAKPLSPAAIKIEALEAKIQKVTFKNSIKTAYDKNEIKVPPPHWEEGKAVKETTNNDFKDGSQRAAVFLADNKEVDVEVEGEITKAENLISSNGTLVGRLGGRTLRIEVSIPLTVGPFKLQAKMSKRKRIYRYAGEFSWQIETPSRNFRVDGYTRLEFFYIYKKPTNIYSTNGVWTEVLRIICKKAGAQGTSIPKTIMEKITSYLLHNHNLRYDTVSGGTNYHTPGTLLTEFRLKEYLDPVKEVNCYDQASAVQVFLAAVGIEVEWIFTEPFGFINATKLIGVPGLCNNPFYKDPIKYTRARNELMAPPYNIPSPVESQIRYTYPNLKARTLFGNHAFCRFTDSGSKYILDACAGPHIGNENENDYLKISIDHTTTNYSLYSPPYNRAAVKNDMKTTVYTGVSDLA